MSSKIVLKNTQSQECSITHQDNVGAVILNSHEIATKGFTEQSIGKMGQTHTATATFTSATNQITMTGIVTALGLEVGDVITFDNANALNNKPHTVESITDNNTIIVNYEHCGNRGNGSLKLFNQTVTSANCKLLAKWFVAPVGLGQGWVNVALNRSESTAYINNTHRNILCMVANPGGVGGTTTIARLTVDGNIICEFITTSVSSAFTVSGTIPYNSTYSYNTTPASIGRWNELR